MATLPSAMSGQNLMSLVPKEWLAKDLSGLTSLKRILEARSVILKSALNNKVKICQSFVKKRC